MGELRPHYRLTDRQISDKKIGLQADQDWTTSYSMARLADSTGETSSLLRNTSVFRTQTESDRTEHCQQVHHDRNCFSWIASFLAAVVKLPLCLSRLFISLSSLTSNLCRQHNHLHVFRHNRVRIRFIDGHLMAGFSISHHCCNGATSKWEADRHLREAIWLGFLPDILRPWECHLRSCSVLRSKKTIILGRVLAGIGGGGCNSISAKATSNLARCWHHPL